MDLFLAAKRQRRYIAGSKHRVYADASLCCQRSQLAHSESEGDLERDGLVQDYAAFGGESSIH